ncbi:MAG: ParA family protein, partial [Gemmatales bacterium]|nr:ParA family protein [Gemmatales bacterium]MDW8385710.1 ParA family protein [Gemmatales bacterium]
KQRDAAIREKKELQERFEALDKVDDHVWRLKVEAPIPNFVSRSKRHTRFISVCNLKGGVGKSTLTGNLGLGLGLKGRYVLMIDLDFQGTLSSYVGDPEKLAVVRSNHATSKKLLLPDAEAKLVHQLAVPVPGTSKVDLIPTDEGLELVEYSLQARFFVHRQQDVRFQLRKLLHDESVTNRYDYVLFDCPPRMTTACINALTCSDVILLPTSLDQLDVAAVGRTLTWIKELKDYLDCELIGVVLMKCSLRKGKLVKEDAMRLPSLQEKLNMPDIGSAVLLDAMIPDSPAIARSAALRRPSVLDEETRHWFLDLVDEVEGRIRHEAG